MVTNNHFNNKFKRTINVLFAAEISERVQNYFRRNLKEIKNINLIFPENADFENLIQIAPQVEVIIGWHPKEELLTNAKRLELFICPGAGVKHLIDVFKELNKLNNIILVNNHGNSYNVAQHTVALLMSYMNKIILHHEWMKNGRWRTGDGEAASILLKSRKIGLLGYGAINKKVHQFLSGFEVEFSVLRKNWTNFKSSLKISKKFTSNQLYEFLRDIDILIIAIPETSSTIGLIGSNELKLLGQKGILINISRGSIVDEESLYKALKNQVINGAAIDVWYERNPKESNDGKKYPYHYPFHELDNIVLSPHRGYSPFDDLFRWDPVIENLKRIAQNRKDFLNIVDLEEEY